VSIAVRAPLQLGAESRNGAGATRFRLLSEQDINALDDVAWLVQDILPAHGSAILYGPAGIGKSFLSLDLALTIASTAIQWHGHAIRPDADAGGTVLYVAAEGAHGLKRRLRAWRAATKYRGPLGIRFVDVAVQLRTLEDADLLLNAVDRVCATADDLPVLVIFDTLSRCMAGAKENAQEDASAVIGSLDYLRTAMGCTTLAVHHTGVIETRERGSTVFRGAVDVLLNLKESDGVLTLESDKVRDGPPLAPMHFRLEPYAESMVLVATNPTADPGRPLGKVPSAVWHHLRAIATGEGATCSEWKESSGVSHASFYRARKTLLDRGLVVNTKGKYRTALGMEVPGAI
jgi:hypothetical protein